MPVGVTVGLASHYGSHQTVLGPLLIWHSAVSLCSKRSHQLRSSPLSNGLSVGFLGLLLTHLTLLGTVQDIIVLFKVVGRECGWEGGGGERNQYSAIVLILSARPSKCSIAVVNVW